jgi:hypothetical protein
LAPAYASEVLTKPAKSPVSGLSDGGFFQPYQSLCHLSADQNLKTS